MTRNQIKRFHAVSFGVSRLLTIVLPLVVHRWNDFEKQMTVCTTTTTLSRM